MIRTPAAGAREIAVERLTLLGILGER